MDRTKFEWNDPIELPKELGGLIGRYSGLVSVNAHKVIVTINGKDVGVALPESLLRKPEPKAINSIYHSNKTHCSYVRVPEHRVPRDKFGDGRHWLRTTGDSPGICHEPEFATWDEIA
jgi:hypothetical protein